MSKRTTSERLVGLLGVVSDLAHQKVDAIPKNARAARRLTKEELKPTTTQVHMLKTWPQPFAALRDGSKTFELRRNDRSFAVGDGLFLQEWDPETKDYVGPWLEAEITYVLPAASPFGGIMPGFCVLGFRLTGGGV